LAQNFLVWHDRRQSALGTGDYPITRPVEDEMLRRHPARGKFDTPVAIAVLGHAPQQQAARAVDRVQAH
jgi:hypothetical protein